MPRPKTITWDKRVAVFLDYRRSGKKVNPVANRYGIARSTVTVIVKEFLAMGFSEVPRAKVSKDLLEEMQEQHIAGLVGLDRKGVGRMYLGPGTGNEVGRQEAMADPLPIRDEARWHLKGTKAGHVIEEATNAIREVGAVMGVAVLASVFAANGGYESPQAFTEGLVAALPIAVVVLAAGAVLALLTPGRAAVKAETEAADRRAGPPQEAAATA